jgi:ATP-dependent RNA helicase DDX23/PRP28
LSYPQPKFLTKEERVAEALRKRQQEADELRRRMEEEKKRRTEFGKEATKAFDDVRKTDKDPERDKDSFR